MNGNLDHVVSAVRAAASATGDASGNCDAAAYLVACGELARTAEELEWAEDNARSALHRIQEARKALAKAEGGAQ